MPDHPAEIQPNTLLLSICVPTYNRRERMVALAADVLTTKEPIELVVHDDGSSDGTFEALQSLAADPRLRVSRGDNRGRTAATLAAIRNATAPFVMTLDDDDDLYHSGLELIVRNCRHGLPDGFGGWIYHMAFEDGRPVPPFPVEISNHLALRADHAISGDKKEVVRTELMASRAYTPGRDVRRAPPSLSWSRIALTHDTLCVNETVGMKRYLSGGISNSITRIKRDNAAPMVLLYATHIIGFARGRYRSLRFLGKAIAGLSFYSLFVIRNRFRRLLRPRTVPDSPRT